MRAQNRRKYDRPRKRTAPRSAVGNLMPRIDSQAMMDDISMAARTRRHSRFSPLPLCGGAGFTIFTLDVTIESRDKRNDPILEIAAEIILAVEQIPKIFDYESGAQSQYQAGQNRQQPDFQSGPAGRDGW